MEPILLSRISLLNTGGGAGGSVWVKCDELDGYGSITSNGGSGANNAGGGSGGRIALYYKRSDYNGTLSAFGGNFAF